MSSDDILDPALESIVDAGPDLQNGMTNHAPMAIEALCALGRGNAVMPWLDRYRRGTLPWPATRQRIDPGAWREALGHPDRASDWRMLFANELAEASWQAVLERWVGRLAPGACASANHGVIRVGHAARALGGRETRPRITELGDALASWASTYQELPTDRSLPAEPLRLREAILRVEVVPPAARRFTGTIVSSLTALGEFPPFAPVIGLARLDGDLSERISEMTETFARVYLGSADDALGTIVFVHSVTGVAALRSMLPYLSDETAREALRYAWQASCGLYAAFGRRAAPEHEIEPPRESPDTLVDKAIAGGDEHAIKFTEACLREHALNPSAAYLASAAHAVEALSG